MDLTQKILELAAIEKVFLYGGGVRDLLRQERPHDLDFLFFETGKYLDRDLFEQRLRNKGDWQISDYYSTRYGFGMSNRFVIKDKGTKELVVKIDLSIDQSNDCVCSTLFRSNVETTGSKVGCHCTSGSRCFDLDVNQLIAQIDSDGKLCQIKFNPRFEQYLATSQWPGSKKDGLILDHHSVLERIGRKEFLIIHDRCSDLKYAEGFKLRARIARMIRRGWKCLNLDCCDRKGCYAHKISSFISSQ